MFQTVFQIEEQFPYHSEFESIIIKFEFALENQIT
jgi:hypothetical protein